MKFKVKLLLWSKYVDLTESQGFSIQQAAQCFQALSPLPKHQCQPTQPLTEDQKSQLWQLCEKVLTEPTNGAIHLKADAEDLALWAKFAPAISLPWKRVEALPPTHAL